MNFGALKTRAGQYLLDLPAETQSLLGVWINQVIRRAQDVYNFRVMRAEAAYVTTNLTRVLGTKPADWKELRDLPWVLDDLGQRWEILWVSSESDAIRSFGGDQDTVGGEPAMLFETETGLDVYPLPDLNGQWPDGNYRVRVPYWKRLPELAADADTNWFTDQASDYVVFAAVAEGMIFNRDENRAAVYVQKSADELRRVIGLDKQSYLGRNLTLVPVPDVYAPVNRYRSGGRYY